MNPALARLSPEHLGMLRGDSGLSDAIIAERGYYTEATFKGLRDLGFTESQSLAPALVIPLHDVGGKPGGFHIRPDAPRIKSGKPVKYEARSRKPPILDVPPRCQPMLGDPSIPLHITEGSKKADAIADQGACALSLAGVWNWRGTNSAGGKVALPDWDEVALNERLVRVVFDSDVTVKKGPATSLLRLKSYLERHGAVVEAIYLPPKADGEKQGIDDFLASGHALSELDDFSQGKVVLHRDDNALPVIVVTNRHLRHITDDCIRCLVAENQRHPTTFQHLGRISRVEVSSGRARIREWSEADAHGKLERVADFVKLVREFDRLVEKPARMPKDVGLDLLAAWEKPLPVLSRIVGTPIVSADGRIVVTPGYDAGTTLYYWPSGPAVAAVPEVVTPADVARAKGLFEEWLADFPFVDAASRANAIAITLTYIVRELIAGPTPLFAVTAPTQGTGKGLLVITAGMIMEGRPPAMTTEARSNEEWRKRFTATLVEGRALVVIDNVKRRLDSAELASILTTENWGDRILGKTEQVEVTNRAVWIVTGNNIELDGEIGRRTVLVRLDAMSDQPWRGRAFRHPDLTAWVRMHREDLIWAYLVLIKNWLALGRPAFRGERLASFEQWSDVVGGVMEAAGIEGFLANRDEVYLQADQESAEWRSFVDAWWEEHGSAAVKAAEILSLLTEGEHLATLVTSGRTNDEKSLKIKLGKALRLRRERVIGNYRLREAGQDRTGAKLFRLEVAEGGAGEEQPPAHPQQEIGAFSDLGAESAEGAEGETGSHARKEEFRSDEECDQEEGAPRGGLHPPHPMHSQPVGSESGFEAAESSRRDSNPLRCRRCFSELSIVAISDICGRCKSSEARR